ncbi:F-box protein At3g49450-like [Arabidopsis lyrata subsp. lyrata]|uniref:F-box protein At3g49450-like n=1 Tax=Arabidopsis lyrata subsp. lyrata TaxID=81972 RepID=UPI000A29BDED|nr:F-box protein At3g49450-like [Arabidopsis lyrata subsp. lyrata]|eukprot:XP_020882497.1 F-box protein At3g49450-like [Arabidopsis lyrata subsp. lyrata]
MSAIKKRKKHVSKEDVALTISSSVGEYGENSGTLLIDLVVDILSRLPAKSVARFRCVSKKWNSLLRSPYFTNLYLRRSPARPRLLITFQAEGKWSFFSSPQYLISDQNSNLVVVDNHMDVPKDYSFGVCEPVCGLLCTKDEWVLSRKRDARMMICNPSTGESKSLPKVRSRRGKVVTYMGYDPIEKEYKVLCMTICQRPFKFKAEEHQVLTLGTGKLKWRMLECPEAHYPYYHGSVCINGVLFYIAKNSESRECRIVSFDMKDEKFKFIPIQAQLSTLINYNGNLGGIRHESFDFMDGGDAVFELWLLNDVVNQKWLRYVHILPPMWKDVVGETSVYVVGTIGTNEIVFSPVVKSNPFYIFNLNMESNSITRVEIKGTGPFEGQQVYTSVNHIENVKLIM